MKEENSEEADARKVYRTEESAERKRRQEDGARRGEKEETEGKGEN